MKYIKYFFQFLLIIICFAIFKILGAKISSNLGGKILRKLDHFLDQKKLLTQTLKMLYQI